MGNYDELEDVEVNTIYDSDRKTKYPGVNVTRNVAIVTLNGSVIVVYTKVTVFSFYKLMGGKHQNILKYKNVLEQVEKHPMSLDRITLS